MTGPAPSATTEKTKRPGGDALAIAGYVLLALAATWPMIADLHQYVISEYMDVINSFGNMWWFHEAVCVLHTSPWHNPEIDYPYGYSMVLLPVWIPYDALSLPIIAAYGADGLPVAFNLISILSLALTGYAMFVLARYLTRDPGASFVAGIALALTPYRYWNLTRWHVTCLELVVFTMYFFLRAVREEKRAAWVGLAVFSALLFYTSPNYTADLALALPVMLVFLAATERDTLKLDAALLRLAKAGALAGAVCAPLIVRIILEIAHGPVPLLQPDSLRIPYSANLLGFFTPGSTLRAYSWLTPHLPYSDPGLKREFGIASYEIFMGWFTLMLAVVGVLARRRESRLLLVLAALFLVLSLGPRVQVGQHALTFSAPYAWLEHVLPWLKVDRTPVRHSAIALICVAALAAMGLAAFKDLAAPRRRAMIQAAAAVAVVLEFNQAPLKLDSIPVPAYVYEIKNDPVYGSVLDLPFLPDTKRLGGYYMMHHYKPLAIQLTSRIGDPKYESSALFKYLNHPRVWLSLSGGPRAAALDALRRELSERKVRYIAAYPRFMEPDDLKGLLQVMTELGPDAVLVENDLHVVYRYPPWGHTE
ncbi:MAG TPA: glycosyltransferase family 39 protein [bacterium]|nr:glycosyltransferase family 39 protein [bacterium]